MPRATQLDSLATRRAGILQRFALFLAAALSRRQDRMSLARLDDRLLRDIGLSPEEAMKECEKPFWSD